MRSRRWWPDLALLLAFAALTLALADGHLLALDQRVADWSLGDQPAAARRTAVVLNFLGQGGWVLMPAALLLTGLLVRRTGSVRALLPFIAAFLLTFCTIGPAKVFFDRAAPRFEGPSPEILFNPYASGAKAMSYPSGHMGNALVWYAVLAFLAAALLRRELTRVEWVAIRVLPVAIVFGTTVYLGYHWLTDSVAGLFLGIVLARVLERIPWDRVPLPGFLGRWDVPIEAPAAVPLPR